MMWRNLWNDAELVRYLKGTPRIQVSTHLFWFQRHHGKMSTWTSCWVFRGLNEVWILFLCSLKVFPRWAVLFLGARLPMQHRLQIYIFKKSFDYMAFRRQSPLIEIQNSWVTFGEPYEGSWRPIYASAVLIIPKRMDWQKLLIEA